MASLRRGSDANLLTQFELQESFWIRTPRSTSGPNSEPGLPMTLPWSLIKSGCFWYLSYLGHASFLLAYGSFCCVDKDREDRSSWFQSGIKQMNTGKLESAPCYGSETSHLTDIILPMPRMLQTRFAC